MKHRLPLALAALFAVLLVWFLRPLRSDEWTIEFDPEMQEGKDAYLEALDGPSQRDGRPNVLVILADDLGLTDISLYGSPHLHTPAIDSIGRDGITYQQAYSSAPICSPSRAGLLTGRYQNRYGFDSQPMTRYARTDLEFFIFDRFVSTEPMHPIRNRSIPPASQILRQGMPPTEILLSEALAASGYRCDVVGKWHLGYGELQHPNNRGFSSFYGFLEAFSAFADPDRPDIETWQFDEFSEKHIWRQERKGYSAIQADGTVVEETIHLTDAFAREAVERIRFYAETDEPFFLYLPFSAPHTPFQALTEYTDRFKHVEDPRKRIYYAMIAQLDDAVGAVLSELESSGLDEDTLVVFSSDNGGATYTGATGNDPLRGGKMSHFEGGIAVPLMMKWPGAIPPGSLEVRPVIHMDVFRTVLGAAGLPLPRDRRIDGVDLLNLEELDENLDRPLFWRSDYNHIVQYRGWKLIMNGKDGKRWLYNVAEDRNETENLIEDRPDMARKLEDLFDAWNDEMAPPAWPRVMDYYYDEDGEGYWFAT